jgi:glycosyltransferase involved in cell wall biosynthesis
VVDLSNLWYVVRNAKKIDILNIYGVRPDSVVLPWVYKLLNRKGIVYLKLDFQIDKFADFLKDKSSFLKKMRVAFFIKAYSSQCFDIISHEIKPRSNELETYPISKFKEKMFYLPNGFFMPSVNEQDAMDKMRTKKNVILVCGRIGIAGNHYKRHDQILKILSQLELKNWSIKFVGTIEPSFTKIMEDFFKNRPDLRDKVIFTGSIWDKKQLQNEYLSAAIYLLTSREESYNIALIEALNTGCYILSTDVGVAQDAIQNDTEIGEIVTMENLPEKFQEIIDGKLNERLYAQENILKRHNRAKEFSWETNISRLYQRILEIKK